MSRSMPGFPASSSAFPPSPAPITHGPSLQLFTPLHHEALGMVFHLETASPAQLMLIPGDHPAVFVLEFRSKLFGAWNQAEISMAPVQEWHTNS